MHKYAHVSSLINVWTNYGESMLHGNGESVLVTKN
jgi:hypothetical protein